MLRASQLRSEGEEEREREKERESGEKRRMMMKKTASSIGFVYAVVLLLAAAGTRPAEAAVHTVGDSVGWTILGSPNYTAWAVSKNFQVGDTVLFVYNKQFHNVVLVTKEDYKACNASSPLATYTTGNDSYTLKHMGHSYFLCGVPGHCAAGQKVDIRVPKTSSSAAPSGAPAPSSLSSGVAAPGPSATPPGANAAALARPKGYMSPLALLSLALFSAGFFMH